MARYIDAERLCRGLRDMASVQYPDKQNTILGVVSTIENTPTADVVEVVRCKDCKCYKEYLHHSTKKPTGWGKCTKIEMDIDLAANDFCCYGERSLSEIPTGCERSDT